MQGAGQCTASVTIDASGQINLSISLFQLLQKLKICIIGSGVIILSTSNLPRRVHTRHLRGKTDR